MLPAFLSARRSSTRGLVGRFALAVALAGGAAMTSAAIAPAAYAQARYSDGFVAAYQPIQDQISSGAPNWEAVRPALTAIQAAAQTPDDKDAAGSTLIQAGSALSDPTLQRRGLELRLESGKVDPAQVGQFNYFVASLANDAGDYAAARRAVDAASAAGYVDADGEPRNDPEYIYMQSYLSEENAPAAVDYLLRQVDARTAAGQQVPEVWLLRGLQAAYDAGLVNQANRVSSQLVRSHRSDRNWLSALQVVNALNELSPQARLDLLRLMRETGALSQRGEYIAYVEGADPRIMGNEVIAVLAEGLEGGTFTADDDYYAEVKGIAEGRAAEDRRSVEQYVRDGEAGDSRLALSTGDVLYSLEDYARAERFYAMALEKGADRDTALTRIGIAQVQQGKTAEAQQTLAEVSGEREPVAAMWSAYAAQMGG